MSALFILYLVFQSGLVGFGLGTVCYLLQTESRNRVLISVCIGWLAYCANLAIMVRAAP